MQYLSVFKPLFTLFSIILFLLSMSITPVSMAAGAMDDFAPDDIVAELKPKLELNEQQVKDLTAALGELG